MAETEAPRYQGVAQAGLHFPLVFLKRTEDEIPLRSADQWHICWFAHCCSEKLALQEGAKFCLVSTQIPSPSSNSCHVFGIRMNVIGLWSSKWTYNSKMTYIHSVYSIKHCYTINLLALIQKNLFWQLLLWIHDSYFNIFFRTKKPSITASQTRCLSAIFW